MMLGLYVWVWVGAIRLFGLIDFISCRCQRPGCFPVLFIEKAVAGYQDKKNICDIVD